MLRPLHGEGVWLPEDDFIACVHSERIWALFAKALWPMKMWSCSWPNSWHKTLHKPPDTQTHRQTSGRTGLAFSPRGEWSWLHTIVSSPVCAVSFPWTNSFSMKSSPLHGYRISLSSLTHSPGSVTMSSLSLSGLAWLCLTRCLYSTVSGSHSCFPPVICPSPWQCAKRLTAVNQSSPCIFSSTMGTPGFSCFPVHRLATQPKPL